MNEILDAYTKALFDADWTEAKNAGGDSVSISDLARTDVQRPDGTTID